MGSSLKSGESIAPDLFAPIASDYERWASVLSLGQDRVWRRELVKGMELLPGSSVLDVAAGTGSITRSLQSRGIKVISLDQSAAMLQGALGRGASGVLGTAERLPFQTGTFDGLTFGYLLRYVGDVAACMVELTRVVRTGGRIGMLEFGRPTGMPGSAWWLYTRVGLPAAGAIIGNGWGRVGSFLGPSIDDFHERYPPETLIRQWEQAGLRDVRVRRLSLGGGLVMWGSKR